MVEFGTGERYGHSMDREYEHVTSTEHHDHGHHMPISDDTKTTSDVGVSMGELGMSLGLGPVPNVHSIKSKLYPGGKKLEFVFTGTGKGSGQSQTPEMYGLKQRAALREIGKANRVDFTTHSTIGVYGLAGMDQQGNFSRTSKSFYMQEVKRAIEFAGDVGRGGPVVVHTGEFNRPVADADWNQIDGDPYKGKFQIHESEQERTSYRVIDTRTGGVIQEARKNRHVARPKWLRYEEGTEEWEKHHGESYFDGTQWVQKGQYIDYWGKLISDPAYRVPRYKKDETGGNFETELLDWEKLSQVADEMTERAREEFRAFSAMTPEQLKDNQKFNNSIWRERIKEAMDKKLTPDKIIVKPEEAFIIETLETNAANSRGWALYYGGDFEESVSRIEKLEEAKKFYEEIDRTTDPKEKWRLNRQVEQIAAGLVPADAKSPLEIINHELQQYRRRLTQSREASSSQLAQAEEAKETIRHVRSAEEYALDEAQDAYARLGITAMRQSEELKRKGTYIKPLTIAMENLFPEHYGSHPDELIKLVKGSQDRMIHLLTKEHRIDEAKARELSQQHITATFDTGHINMWRKYWKGDQNNTLEQNDKEFDKWLLSKVEQMVKAGIIGHVHLDDNYGYHDDHLAPGEGNTPIREMVKILKANGYNKELIVEPGADYTTDVSGFHSVMKTWRHFGSPAYGSGSGMSPKKRTWEQVGYGWFGQNQPPYFTFGSYAPSEDWTLWSGVPLE